MLPRIKEFINRGTMPLVGRDRELQAIMDAFSGLLEGEPRSVWMTGPAGVGKSRLLDELKSRVRTHAARSLVIHAKWYEGEGTDFGPLSNALEVLRPALAAPMAARIYREGAIASVDAAVEAVQIASRRYPIILIFDDLHYLQASAELERFTAALEEIPVLLIATARPTENQAVRSLRSALAGSIPPLDMEVGRLDGAGIAEAATLLFGASPPDGMLEQLAALSAGVPLKLREVFRELMSAEHVVPGDDEDCWEWRTETLDDEELRTIGDRVHNFTGRLASLPTTEQGLLALTARLGEQVNRDLLRQVAERTIGWDDQAFERLILAGLVSLAAPSVRFSTQEAEGRTCFSFSHTLLWKAAADMEISELPSRGELTRLMLDVLTGGVGELYSVAALEGLDVSMLDSDDLRRLFSWLVGVSRKLPQIHSETFVSLCKVALEPCRRPEVVERIKEEVCEHYLAALSAYSERLYLTGASRHLHDIAGEIARILEGLFVTPPGTPEERIIRLDAAVVVWHDALFQGDPGSAKGFLDELLKELPPPSEQNDRELRGAAEAIRLRASYSIERGDFSGMLDLATPYISEMDRMRPETLNAMMKVLLYAMLHVNRIGEAREMVNAGLRLRHEADLFTEYELLRHAAAYSLHIRDFAHTRRYSTEQRHLTDRYPVYRNLSTNYFYLPYVAAYEGKVEELEQLERDFRATQPPARSSVQQTAIARYNFQLAWNQLGRPERSLKFAEEGAPDVLTPIQQVAVARERLRSYIHARNTALMTEALASYRDHLQGLGDKAAARYAPILEILQLLANAVAQDQPDDLLNHVAELKPGDMDAVELFYAARILLEAGARSPGRKREFNDGGYQAIDLAIKSCTTDNLHGLAHHWLDELADLLPKTRLQRFRTAADTDPRDVASGAVTSAAGESGEDLQKGKILRTFGALRIEGADESGAKLESKTRTLVAALVVARLGDVRSIGELTRDRLADLLWPDMSLDRAVNNLHATLSYARRFLGGSDTVAQHDGVYTLSDEVNIDAVKFREEVNKADRLYDEGIYFGAAVAYSHAIDYATGDFLEGMYAEWVDNVRETLRGELATALERLIAIEIDRENYSAVPSLAEQLLALDDLHDGAYEALIRSAASRGARREAFTYFKRYETALDAYGAGPTRRITELIERVRAGEL